MKKSLNFLLFSIFIISIGLFSINFFYHKNTKIKNIDIVSNNNLQYISKQDIINNIAKLNLKWSDIDINEIKKYFQKIPGIYFVLVKKIWPSTLVIYLNNKKPIAYWNNNEILLNNMEIIKPKIFESNNFIPSLSSNNKNSEKYVYKTYLELNKIAVNNNTKITSLIYDANQFIVELSYKYKVNLGSNNLKQKLNLFFNTYQKVKDFNDVKIFDMRYNYGFAVNY